MTDDEAALPLFGHRDAETEFLSALASGRLHHAWIIEGPSGIGKARLVTRLASVLLGAGTVDADPAGAPATDPVMQKILSHGHPDLKSVSRETNEKGNLKQDISVQQIRELSGFFALKPALGGWRIGILDSLDEMNVSGLNALLKTLEEPPAQSMLFLISHGTQPVLATIRSRCQILRLRALSVEDTLSALEQSSTENPESLAPLLGGRPGRVAELASPTAMSAVNAARNLLTAMPSPNEAVLSQAILAAGQDDTAFRAFSEHLLSWLADKSETSMSWSDVWFQSQQTVSAHRNLHMSTTQAASRLIGSLQSAFETS